MLLVIAAFSMFAPANDDTDFSPTTYNSGSAGTKAAYLLLGGLGYGAHRWEAPPGDLKNVDAAKTTLVLAEPNFPTEGAKQVQAEIADFLSRGGHVLATGKEGAYFLPDAKTDAPSRLYQRLCFSTPEGQGPLARAGRVSLADYVRWTAWGPRVSSIAAVWRRCGCCQLQVWRGRSDLVELSDAAYQPGIEKEDASLKLVLASGRAGSKRAVR